MPIVEHPPQLLPHVPACKYLAQPPQRKRILDAILENTARWSRRSHDVPMYPRREWPGDLLVGELAPFVATIDEVTVPSDPSQLHRTDMQHKHRQRPVAQRCGWLLNGHFLPRGESAS